MTQEILGPEHSERPQFPYKEYAGWRQEMRTFVTVNGQPLRETDPSYRKSGFEWGYEGGGPTNLSYSLLFDYFRGRRHRFQTSFARTSPTPPWDYYTPSFRSQIVRQMPPNGNWALTSHEIEQWLDSKPDQDRPYDWEQWARYLTERAEHRVKGFGRILNGIIIAEPIVEMYSNSDATREWFKDLTRKDRYHNLDWVEEVETFEEQVLGLTDLLRNEE